MKFDPNDPPRVYSVGRDMSIHIKDCGRVALEPDEQVTFVTPSGAEYDLARKSWGFYATPSMNARLLQFGLRAVLVKSETGKYFMFLVERGHEDDCQRYIDDERYVIVAWLDSDEALQELDRKLAGA